MMKFWGVALAVVCASSLAMAEGLETGSKVGAFYVKDVTGPAAGTKLCYRCKMGGSPVVSIFARDLSGEVGTLIKEVDSVVAKNEEKKMGAFVVLLSDEPEGKEGALKQLADQKKITKTPLTTFDSVVGPPSYKISETADVTVMMWVDGVLKVNETFKSSDLTKDKISAVVGKTSEILN